MDLNVAIIGGGPGGLFSAYLLLKKGYQVDLYDHSSGLAKKFLIAGNGGLNLTHSEEVSLFASRYGKDEAMFKELLKEFSPNDLRDWCHELGVETFIGSSGRVFPKKLKAGEMLVKWSKLLKSFDEFQLYLKHSLVKITKDRQLTFKTDSQAITKKYDKVILAMGGASWPQTGSDGEWKSIMDDNKVLIKPFKPMNCGFNHKWSDFFITKVNHYPLKNIELSLGEHKVRGEIMLTPFGIEGGAVYAISNHIRDKISMEGKAEILIDLKPDLPLEQVIKKLGKRSKKQSLSSFVPKALNLPKEVYTLLIELLGKINLDDNNFLAFQIKNLSILLDSPRPIAEAISTSGGVSFDEITDNFELKSIPGIYVVGEMLDFEAPTGGYLLQGCFSTAFRAVNSF